MDHKSGDSGNACIVKRRIDFQKLIDGAYPLNVELEVFNWMLATGKKYDRPRAGYGHFGMDQIVYGYSANTHDSYTDLGKNFKTTLQLGFINAIVKTPLPSVLDWRNAEHVGLGKYRMLSFPDERPFEGWDLYWEIKGIYEYEGKLLKKEHFHPDYPERVKPKILGMQFSTAGRGYLITLEYSFKNFNYEPGWKQSFSQREGEGIDMFVHRFHREMSRLLVPHVSIDQANESLQSAAKRCNTRGVIEALRNGADPNARNGDGVAALQHACARGDVDIARLLLFYGADVNSSKNDTDSTTILQNACWNIRADLVNLLLTAGADPNARDAGGNTALHYASRIGAADIVRLLLDAGADVNAKNNARQSSLDMVTHNGHIMASGAPVIPILLEHGATSSEKKLNQILTAVINTDVSNPHKDLILDWFQENRSEMYFSKFCTMPMSLSPGMD